jgi:hypothetical protein
MRLAWALAAAMGASVCGETELQTMLHGERCAPRGGEQVTEANVLSYRRGAVLAGTSVLHRALVANRGWLMMAEKIPGVGDEPEYGGMFFEAPLNFPWVGSLS